MSRLLLGLLAALAVLAAADVRPARAEPSAAAPAVADVQASEHKVLVLLRLPPEHFRAGGQYAGRYADRLGASGRRRIAAQLAREQGLTLVTDWPMPILGVDCYVMAVPTDRSPEDVAQALSRDSRVSWAQPMNVYRAEGGPAARAASHNDPLYAAQPAATLWRLADLHEIATGARVRVAVIDSMVDAAHPDLVGQVEILRNFTPERGGTPEAHGTGVAGVIAARADNGVGIAGVAPGARLLALRACWQTAAATLCDSLSLAKAIDYAIAQDVQVINLSLSGPADELLRRLLTVALARGVTVVGAYDGALPNGGFPASLRGVIAAADDSTPVRTGGIYLAPGRGIPTTQPGGRWYLVDGNSYAAAHVSGLYALLRQRRPVSPGAGALVLVRARDGEIDACASLLRVAEPCGCACARPVAITALNRP